MAVVAVQGSMIGRADKNGPQGSGVNEDVSFTLDAADRHAVAYCIPSDRRSDGFISIHELQEQKANKHKSQQCFIFVFISLSINYLHLESHS